MGKKRKKAAKKHAASKKKRGRKGAKTAPKAKSKPAKRSPFLDETARRIEDLFKRLKVAEYEFQVAKKRDPGAPNESLRVHRDIGDEVQAFKAGPSYGTDAVKRLAEAAGSSASSLAVHASFAELPGKVLDRLVQEGRPWRWVSKNMSELAAEKPYGEPGGIDDLDWS